MKTRVYEPIRSRRGVRKTVGDDDGQGKRLFDMIEMPFREEFSELFIRGINGKGNVQESV